MGSQVMLANLRMGPNYITIFTREDIATIACPVVIGDCFLG
jgi:hypothetical protein